MPYQGHIDTPQSDVLAGWAVDDYGAPCEIAISINGGDPVLVMSDRPRTDLLLSDISTGLGGFRIDIAALLAQGANEIVISFPDGTPVPGGRISRIFEGRDPASLTYKGAIDSPQAKVVNGWAVTEDGLPCTLSVDINGTEHYTIESTGERADLAKSDISRGLGGFRTRIVEKLREGTNRVSIRFPNGEHLPGSPITRVVGDANAFMPEPEVALPPAAAPPPPPPPPAEVPAPVTPRLEEPAPAPAMSVPVPPAPQQATPAPRPKAAAPNASAPKNVSALPAAPRKKPALPSLAELDELSLDDLSLAVAAGVINVPPPQPSPAPPPTPETAPLADDAPASEPAPEPAPAAPPRRGLFRRLFGR